VTTIKYEYSKVITNSYLNKQKEIKAASPSELSFKVKEQLKKWGDQEKRQRERDRIQNLKEQAEKDSKQAQKLIEEYNSILKNSLEDRLKWSELKKEKRPYPLFDFSEKPPIKKEVIKNVTQNKYQWLEAIFPILKQRRLKKEKEAEEIYQKKVREEENNYQKRLENYRNKLESEKAKYEQKKYAYETEIQNHNKDIQRFKEAFESADQDAVERFAKLLLKNSRYPKGLKIDKFEVIFDPQLETLQITCRLPNLEQVTSIKLYKFVASRKQIDPVPMKKTEFNDFYENVLYQICLRTIHKIFHSIYISQCNTVIFNGWVRGIDKETGNEFESCILSCRAERKEFESFNLRRVEPKECFRKLKGLSAGPLAALAPVQPIMELNRDDSRFVESKKILASINSETNLATMDWQDFEHLIAELFAKEFSHEGAEVKVTQSSRDWGVDAVIFDPDPIRGGKIVIQAKRYNNVVPVSSVRDLFGVVHNEGAIKGILVTTSYFGNDSRKFVADKPLKLISGNELIALFNKHGYDVTIRSTK
jgi:restriction system protein